MRLTLSLGLLLASPLAVRADEQVDFFERKIRPVLVEHCYACHSAEGTDVEGGLRLDSRDAMRRGGESGPAVMPKQVDESLLISAIKYESLEMPPDRKLPDEVVADFVTWVERGAIDPRDEIHPPAEQVKSEIDFEQGRQFWAFQKPTRHALPSHELQTWCRTDADHFIAAGLAAAELQPTATASPELLARRLAFDLTGLPPTTDLRSATEQLSSDAGYAQVVDSLIASPAFGEHWARLWLDLMRFAEDQAHIVGNDRSLCFPNSFLYRDWVISALNQDMPFDRFVQLQLAADLMTPEDSDDDVALGFMGLGPKYYRRNAPEVMAEEWEDRVDIVSRGLLGLTVACARCHDHKFDPIGTADYYALAGVFASVEMFNRPLDEERKTDKKGAAQDPADALHIIRDSQPVDLSIMVRGDVNRKGPVVPKRFISVLSPGEPPAFREGSGRLELARHIASRENPLTARVLVNRVWTRLIGQPLVGTPSNFGKLGDRPTHPELLDDLAVRFMDNGWSVKWLCREIVLSATYRQGSEVNEAGLRQDQGNQLLWRMNRKRLSVEQWRDAVLAAADNLDRTLGGPSIDPSDPQVRRRTLYSEASRLKLNPMLALFDYPDPNAHSERRARTTTASQKLFLLNSPFMVEQAAALTQRLQPTAADPQAMIEQAYQLLFARPPSPQEVEVGRHYLADGARQPERYLHALMATNEMLFVE